MSEGAVTLHLPGADLPRVGDPLITDVVAGGLATIDPALPGASAQAAASLGMETGAHQLLLILVDGLGYELIEEYVGHTPTLRRVRGDVRSIHTVVPSTTAAAITAFGTGECPGATNMVGFSVAYRGTVMNLLAMEGGPAPSEWQPVPTYFERLAAADVASAVVSPARFAGSGLTGAALRGARHVPAETLDERVSAALRELRAGTPVVYLYWSEIDHAGHGSGVGSDSWIANLEEFDAGLARLLRSLPAGVRTVMTADHGMINVDASQIVDVASTPALREGVRIVAGETRAVHVHADAGRADEVEARWRDVLGESAWIVSGEAISALIGAGDGAAVIGDFLVLARGRGGVVDSRTQSASAIAMPGVHGSLTSTEMRIPVVVLS
ncbi:alkaline phosphatase family protein [Pauljensenia sp. UMB3104]|uniref:alkaline phosphatase family protein n=1 Tax=Pauljensenia sp. UMB3104 TaxID=3046331 RepID=UPI00254EF9B9|nr:alkaline phosphatase family protein [Pauljensenia sp. UMB3104]